MTVAKLDLRVAALIDPQQRGRRFLASAVAGLVGTRAAGLVATPSPPSWPRRRRAN